MKHLFPFLLSMALLMSACGPGPGSGGKAELREQFIEVDGVRIFTKAVGKGEPILVVHGGPGLDHSYLLPQMKGLAKDHQLIFYDQRCSGRSDAGLDSSQVNLRAFLRDIDAVRAHYGIERVNVLGHSWGGLLAMYYAIRYPDKVQSLVLSNGMGPTSETRQQENALLKRKMTEDDAQAMIDIQSSDAFAEGDSHAYEDFFRALFRIEFYDRAKAEELTLTFPEDFAQRSAELGMLYRDLAYYDIREELEKVEVPVLLVYGSEEPLVGLVGKPLEGIFPNARLEVLPECGHFPYIEQPEAFFKLLHDFVTEVSGQSE